DKLEADPGRLEEVEAALDRIATLRRRYHAQTYAELLELAAGARAELGALGEGHDPARAAAQQLAAAQAEGGRPPAPLTAAPRRAGQGGAALRRSRRDGARRSRAR